MKPTVGKTVAVSILSAGVLGGGAALGIATTYDSPERAHYRSTRRRTAISPCAFITPAVYSQPTTSGSSNVMPHDSKYRTSSSSCTILFSRITTTKSTTPWKTTCAITTWSSSATIVLPTAHCLLAWGLNRGKLSSSKAMTSQSYSICAKAAT